MALVPDPSASRHAILHIATNHIRFEVGLDGTNAPSSVLNTFEIPPAPAFILAILFLFVAVVCFFKEVLPQLLLRWDRYRQKPGSNYHKIVSLRILWFFSNVLLSATGTCRARMTPRASPGSALTKLPLPSIHPSISAHGLLLDDRHLWTDTTQQAHSTMAVLSAVVRARARNHQRLHDARVLLVRTPLVRELARSEPHSILIDASRTLCHATGPRSTATGATWPCSRRRPFVGSCTCSRPPSSPSSASVRSSSTLSSSPLPRT